MSLGNKAPCRKLMTVMLSLALVLGSLGGLTLTASAAKIDVWDGSVATAFEGGDGTEASPYQIDTAAQFAYFAACVEGEDFADYNSKYYVLENDLDLSNQNWVPIGLSLNNNYKTEKCFLGNFDGQGHTIKYAFEKNQYIDRYEAYGLFGFSEGTIANLTVSGSITIDCPMQASWCGGLVGLLAGDIKNCTSNVNITLTENSDTNACFIGGLTGAFQDGTMQGCLYSGTLTSKQYKYMGDLHFGGISGTIFDATVTACKNEGAITIQDGMGSAGGIAGMVYTGGYAVTSVISDCYNTGAISRGKNSGGIAGVVSAVIWDSEEGNALAEVSGCYSTGIVTSSGNSGAVCGMKSSTGSRAAATVKDCYYTSTAGIPDTTAEEKNLEEIFDILTANAAEGLWTKDSDGNIVLHWELCDYREVRDALGKIPKDLSIYTDEAVAALNAAKDAVVPGLVREKQATVNGYAQAIEEAIAALVKKGADYKAVDDALAKIPDDLSIYTDESVAVLNNAKNAVVTGKNITEQTTVDEYAKVIEDAIKGLVKKTVAPTTPTDPEPSAPTDPNPSIPNTGDKGFTPVVYILLTASLGCVLFTLRKSKVVKVK